MNSNHESSIDRIPTLRERLFAIIISGFLSLLFGLIGSVSAFMLLSDSNARIKENIYFLIGIVVFLGISLAVLYRSIRGKRKEPSYTQLIITGYIILAASAICFILGIVNFGKANTFYLLAIACSGVPLGITTIGQGNAKKNRT